MAKMLKPWLLGLLCLGWVSWANATTCTTANNVCQKTLNVEATCTNDNCVCSAPATMTAVRTGCAVTLGLGTPVLSIDELNSGEVQTGTDITLTCTLALATGTDPALSFEWYKGTTKVDAETSRTYAFTAEAGNTDIKCKAVSGDITSPDSNAITITGIAADAIPTKKPIIKNSQYTKVAEGATLEISCINLQLLANGVTPKFDDGSATAVASPVTLGTGGTFAQKTYKCMAPDTSTVFSDEYTSPAAATALNTIDAVEIYEPSASSITLAPGVSTTLKCRPSDPTLYFEGSAITYKWQLNNNDIDGETAATLALPSDLTAGTQNTYKCIGTNLNANPSASITVNVVDLAASVRADPPAPTLGEYMKVQCLIAAPTTENLVYGWTIGGDLPPGQTDNTLQINAVEAGDSSTYQCSFSNGDFPVKSAQTNIVAAALNTLTPTISSSKTTTNFGTGEKYTLKCDFTGFSAGMTFKWLQGGSEVAGQTAQTFEITATAASVPYKCQVIKDASTESQQSADFPVEGKDFTSVVVTGTIQPVAATTPQYTCTAAKASGVTGDVTYQWKLAGNNIETDGTGSTYTVPADVVVAGTPLVYSCDVKAGSGTAMSSNSLSVSPVAAPATPTVTVNAVGGQTALFEGGSYILTCASASYDAGETVAFVWQKDGTDLPTTSLTYTIGAMADTDAGVYTCKITVKDLPSAFSTKGLTITKSTAKGRVCSSTNYATVCGDRTNYDGNCIAGRCTCATDVTLYEDACGEERKAGAGNGIKASVTFLVLGLLIFVIFG